MTGTQADCAAMMAGLARDFGKDAIGSYGHSFPAPRHGPDWVIVQMRLYPGRRPARRRRPALPRPRLPRRRKPGLPATMIPVKTDIRPAGPPAKASRR